MTPAMAPIWRVVLRGVEDHLWVIRRAGAILKPVWLVNATGSHLELTQCLGYTEPEGVAELRVPSFEVCCGAIRKSMWFVCRMLG